MGSCFSIFCWLFMMWKDRGRIFRYGRDCGSICNFDTLCIVIFHVTITQPILVPITQPILVSMPQLLVIQQSYSVPSRTHYFCDISRFPHRPWSIISCVHRISHFKTENYCVRVTCIFLSFLSPFHSLVQIWFHQI